MSKPGPGKTSPTQSVPPASGKTPGTQPPSPLPDPLEKPFAERFTRMLSGRPPLDEPIIDPANPNLAGGHLPEKE
ncbi:MAG: hypothetical protein HQL59_13845 [Magnetococcales bacterium]|nr:hypothetical protein [Magnetococcales bacterium]